LVISSAAIAASHPLFPAFVPARSSACSMDSVVSTPKLTGRSSSAEICATPLATPPETYSKCGVAPRITAPRAMSPSKRPVRPSRRSAMGISHAPGTQATSIFPSSTPWRTRQSRAPSRSCFVISSLKRLTTIPIRFPSPVSRP
jgi:hypothetical protein